MTTQTQTLGSRTAYTITLNSLANGTYVASSAVDLGASVPLDVVVEVEITPGSTTGNKKADVFVKVSEDGTNYTSGPESGTTTTDEPNLLPLGAVPLASASTLQRRQFSLLVALGFVPRYHKIIVKNDSGVAFSGSGCAANYQTSSGSSA